MTNQIFEISIRLFDKDYRRMKETHRICGKDIAIQYGMEFGVCENVETVDVVDIFTGEVILTMENGELTWVAEE